MFWSLPCPLYLFWYSVSKSCSRSEQHLNETSSCTETFYISFLRVTLFCLLAPVKSTIANGNDPNTSAPKSNNNQIEYIYIFYLFPFDWRRGLGLLTPNFHFSHFVVVFFFFLSAQQSHYYHLSTRRRRRQKQETKRINDGMDSITIQLTRCMLSFSIPLKFTAQKHPDTQTTGGKTETGLLLTSVATTATTNSRRTQEKHIETF